MKLRKNRNLSSHYPIKRMVGAVIALARMRFWVFLCLMVSLTIGASVEAWGDGSVSYPDNLMTRHKADYVIIAPELFYNSDAPADKGNNIILFWQLSSDDSRVARYVIYRSDSR
ncbi:hypothetical protein FJZ31_08640 [Candidatus Poribacteria bacterium]|nr:hypothetical protein [Candidatus Poribacteria bacterium]